ncbi:unnamed protein product [Urochloa decumbens]|uniref:F-box domain-containing protein n=1 Tax=Urochloa decumbens TaxID=240449 RepID=A0ABC9FNB3_9POAL
MPNRALISSSPPRSTKPTRLRPPGSGQPIAMEPPPPPPPRPPPALPDELVEEILIRSPPEHPASLVRAALVCKRWCGLVSGAGLRRRFIQIHRAPPMLGFLFGTRSRTHFVPTSTFRPRPPHGYGSFWRAWRPIDARHGRVLLHGIGSKPGEPIGDLFAVWDPITGDLRDVPTPREYLNLRCWTAAVLCAAASDACDHLDCHCRSFQVVIVGCDDHEQTDACIYSSVTGAWRQPASSQLQHHGAFLYMEAASAFVSNTLYFVFGAASNLLEYNVASQEMSVIDLPPAYSRQYVGCMTTEDGRLGFSTAEYSKLYWWSREAGHDGDDGWTKTRSLESLSSRS